MDDEKNPTAAKGRVEQVVREEAAAILDRVHIQVGEESLIIFGYILLRKSSKEGMFCSLLARFR